jgi:hypothetical protein
MGSALKVRGTAGGARLNSLSAFAGDVSRTFSEQNFLAPIERLALHGRHENAVAEYEAIRAIRRIASLKQSRSHNDEDA